jgi:hypothetical protein
LFVDWSSSGTLVYIEAMQPLHIRLQQILTQAAGYALLVVMHGQRLALLDAPVVSARAVLVMALAEVGSVRVPDTARRHYEHTMAASDAIRRALDLLVTCLRPGADDHARTELTQALRAATDHLRLATRLLPGFAMADLSQACCAAHAVRSPLICQTAEG